MTNYHIINMVLEINFPYPVPKDRITPEQIEDYFNNSRLCLTQLVQEVAQQNCLCDETRITYVCPATEEDLKNWNRTKFKTILDKSR